MHREKRWHLLGCPDDRAVRNNHGRVGAAQAPAALRHWLRLLSGDAPVWDTCNDLGDTPVRGTAIADDHNAAVQCIAQIAQGEKDRHAPLVIIGGGHDYAYPMLCGMANADVGKAKTGCVNLDPHLDLREPKPDILSGSPFHLALEHKALAGEDLVEFGTGYHCNGPALWEYAKTKHVRIIPFADLREKNPVEIFRVELSRLCARCDQIAISLDLDCLQAAFAPGVSAPTAEGFTPSEILAMLVYAAREPKVCLLGVFELNPVYDIDARTARLAAACVYHFIREKLFLGACPIGAPP